MNTKRAYCILPTTVTSNVWVSVCVCMVCAWIEIRQRHMWCLFCYLKRKSNVPMCRSTCGPKNSSLSSCHTQAVRLTPTLHFLTYVWHITETKMIKKWECGNDNQSKLFRLFSEMYANAVWAAATVCSAGLWCCLWTLLITLAFVCTGSLFFCLMFVLFFFVFNTILSSGISRTVYQQHVLWDSSISYTFCPEVWPKSTPHLQL